MNDLIEFLTKCNDEDEAAARAASRDSHSENWESGPNHLIGGYWVLPTPNPEDRYVAVDMVLTRPTADFVAHHDPARVLRECAARRLAIAKYVAAQRDVAQIRAHGGRGTFDEGREEAYRNALIWSAQSYIDRPGFKDEWRVS